MFFTVASRADVMVMCTEVHKISHYMHIYCLVYLALTPRSCLFFTLSLIFQAGTHKWEIREVSSGNLLSISDVIVSQGSEEEPDLEEKIPIRQDDYVDYFHGVAN